MRSAEDFQIALKRVDAVARRGGVADENAVRDQILHAAIRRAIVEPGAFRQFVDRHARTSNNIQRTAKSVNSTGHDWQLVTKTDIFVTNTFFTDTAVTNSNGVCPPSRRGLSPKVSETQP